jgi:hypothetical protein
MKKLRNLKQSLLGKSIFKRLRNTINPGSSPASSSVASSGSTPVNFNQLTGKKKIYSLLESSSVYVINSHVACSAAVQAANPNGTISTSSLISKCPAKKDPIASSLAKKQGSGDYEKLSELDRIAIANASKEMASNNEFYQVYFSHYIGHTVISYDTNLNGSATNFISKIIDTV